MFKIYFKVALRNLLRDRLHAVVNIVGLSMGLAVAVIVFLYIQSEVSYDNYHTRGDRLYRLTSTFVLNGEPVKTAVSSHRIGPLLQEQNSGVEAYTRTQYVSESFLKSDLAEGNVDHLLAADSGFFKVFDYKLLYGDPATCLSKPLGLVLSRPLAEKYFGEGNPVGKTLVSGMKRTYTITGVLEEIPENTHQYFTALFSMNTMLEEDMDMGMEKEQDLNLWNASVYTYLVLKEGYTSDDFYEDYPEFWTRNMAMVGKKLNGYYYPLLQPIREVHLAPQLDFDFFETGNVSYIYGFAAIGLFLLLLAAINYTNMATARSSTRTREVGLRKVMGSRRGNLITQFLGESLLTSLIALLLALALVEMILKLTPFNDLMNKQLHLDLVANPVLAFSVLLITLLLGIVSGIYPAFSLSSGNAGVNLRPRHLHTRQAIFLRRGLVIFQFSVSIGVIIATFLMKNQVDYMRYLDMGFSDDNTVVVPVTDSTAVSVLPELRERIEALPGVMATTTAHHVPGGGIARMVFHIPRGDSLEEVVSDYMEVGDDYVKGMDLRLVKGPGFTQSEDSLCAGEFVINQTAERDYFGGDALGKPITFGLKMGRIKEYEGKVVGVVEDFNVHSLKYEISPLIMKVVPSGRGLLHVRMNRGSIRETLGQVQETWEATAGKEVAFTPFFINEKFEKLYATDLRLSRLMGILAFLCVLISVMGLLGFASFSIEQRKKEIGIRKVLGASLLQIMVMLFREIFYLIIFSSLLGSILAWLVVQSWLQQFAYRAEIPMATFFLAGALSILLALLTVSYHSVKAALSNPVHALKYE